MSTTPVPAESTAGIELASATERVAAAKIEALGPQVEGKASMCADTATKISAQAWCIARARGKSICCGDGIQTRAISPLKRAPLLDTLMWREDDWGGYLRIEKALWGQENETAAIVTQNKKKLVAQKSHQFSGTSNRYSHAPIAGPPSVLRVSDRGTTATDTKIHTP